MLDIKATAMENLDRKYHSQFVLKKIINGYRRFDPTRGMEYILDLLLSDRHHQNTETVKRVHLVRPLGKVELVPMPYVTENMMVTIVLPLKESEIDMFDTFLNSYVRACIQANEDVRLIVVFLQSDTKTKGKDLFGKVKSLITDTSKKYDTKGKLSWKYMDHVATDIKITDQLLPEIRTDALILFTTVNAEFSIDLTNSYLNRVRMNTIKGKQVFFPMGFSQYKPNLIYKNKKAYPESVEIGHRLGQFSTDAYDHCSFYSSDFKTARKTLSLTAVGSEDLFSMFLSFKTFHVFRAVEPNLKLKWMNLTCDPRVSAARYQECVTRNLEGLASQQHLALLIYEHRNEVVSQSDVKGAIQKSFDNPAEVLKPHQENIKTLSDDPKTEGMLVVQDKMKKAVLL